MKAMLLRKTDAGRRQNHDTFECHDEAVMRRPALKDHESIDKCPDGWAGLLPTATSAKQGEKE
jgi:hypothetical protein